MAGRFSFLILTFVLSFSVAAQEEDVTLRDLATLTAREKRTDWPEFESRMATKLRRDRIDGLSYLISGSLALVGGLVGQAASTDPLEKGVYTLFQTIGVASIGYGIYKWKIGDDERWIYQTASRAPGLTPGQRAGVMRSYFDVKQLRSKDEKFVRALTHGLIAALNFYGATQQKNDSLKNSLIFLGGVNTLATISFTF